METYDPSKIGACIFARSSHAIYEYGSNEVIKFDRADFVLGSHAKHRTFHDHAICKEFFGEYLLDTRVARSPNGKRLVDIQPRVVGHYLCKNDLRSPKIREQFKEILECHRRLKDAGYPDVDFVGQGGIFSRRLSNIFVLDDGSLRIIDASLLDEGYTDSGIFKRILRWGIARLIRRQKRTIELLLA